jgi:hypothetical protein
MTGAERGAESDGCVFSSSRGGRLVVLALVLTDPLFAPGATGQALLEPARRGEDGRAAEPTSHLMSSNIDLNGQLDDRRWGLIWANAVL